MGAVRRFLLAGVAALLCGVSGGCSLFPDCMQQHQLWKWNRTSSPSRDPFFSVQDKIPVTERMKDEGGRMNKEED